MLGVGISCIDIPRAVEVISDWIVEDDRQFVCVTGMHGIMECRQDETLRMIHNRSGLTTPDGMPMVWAAHRAGAGDVSRVYGPDLMAAVCNQAAREGWSSYFVGGAPGVAEALIRTLRESYPGLRIAGHESPPFRALEPDEELAMVTRINQANPDLVWVGLGTPKQEVWMWEHRPQLEAPVILGVGAAFDLVSGALRQAPRWMQRSGLEWLYRLCVEPRRLWRRYLLNIPVFLVGLLRQPPTLYRAADEVQTPSG